MLKTEEKKNIKKDREKYMLKCFFLFFLLMIIYIYYFLLKFVFYHIYIFLPESLDFIFAKLIKLENKNLMSLPYYHYFNLIAHIQVCINIYTYI